MNVVTLQPHEPMKPTLVRSIVATALLATLASSCAGPREPRAAPVPEREVGAFLVRLGADTVAVEEFSRSADRVEGRQVVRSPRTQIREYSGDLRADGTLSSFELVARDAPGAEPTLRTHMDFGADSVTVRVTRDTGEQTFRLPASIGSLPFVGYSVALYELSFADLRARGADSVTAALVPLLGGQQSFPYVAALRGTGGGVVRNIAGESRVRIDHTGRVLSWDGLGSTLALTADRLATVNLDRLAQDFAARDAAGRGLGTLSPRDTVTAQVGAATVSVEYSRPLARGREIFGNVVPLGEVWRTGANQATTLRTDRDLMVGGTHVPAGAYSVFTIPGPTGWELILNRQTGQWGTEYDRAQDLARIPMTRQATQEHVEQFTIAIEPAEASRASLHLAWGDTRASVPIHVH